MVTTACFLSHHIGKIWKSEPPNIAPLESSDFHSVVWHLLREYRYFSDWCSRSPDTRQHLTSAGNRQLRCPDAFVQQFPRSCPHYNMLRHKSMAKSEMQNGSQITSYEIRNQLVSDWTEEFSVTTILLTASEGCNILRKICRKWLKWFFPAELLR